MPEEEQKDALGWFYNHVQDNSLVTVNRFFVRRHCREQYAFVGTSLSHYVCPKFKCWIIDVRSTFTLHAVHTDQFMHWWVMTSDLGPPTSNQFIESTWRFEPHSKSSLGLPGMRLTFTRMDWTGRRPPKYNDKYLSYRVSFLLYLEFLTVNCAFLLDTESQDDTFALTVLLSKFYFFPKV